MSNADFWARKLGVPPQARPADIPLPPSQVPMTPYTAPRPVAPASKAQSASQTDACPECGSNAYMSPSPSIARRCFDCGYPTEQSGSLHGSLTGAKVEGNVKAARGNNVSNNWNPQGIIGRVD